MLSIRLLLFPALLLALTACSQAPLTTLQEQLPAERQLIVLDTPTFPLLAGVDRKAITSAQLRVYIEGDGRAWITPSQPSLDPTPQDSWFARLALEDPQPSAWLARPCQYVSNASCEVGMWTHGRFSAAVVAAMSQALDQLKQRYGSQHLELIGYSGGAAIALLLASQRDDVIAVQSLAGNLSPRLWSQQLGLSPLYDSLDPLDAIDKLEHLPQRHLLGQQDKVVPADLAGQWQHTLRSSPCVEQITIAGADHWHGWQAAWRQWRAHPLKSESLDSCRRRNND